MSNWRLTVVQILAAIWIWLAMFDLKVHVLHGSSFHALRGPVLIPIGLVIVGLTAASFLLNAVFAFAIADRSAPRIRPAFGQAERRLPTILGSGAIVGALLAFSTIGGKPSQSGRDKPATTAVGGAIGATVCAPPYLLGRLGILMLGSRVLLIPGIFVTAIGVTLQAGATGAVRAIKMSVRLNAPRQPNRPISDPRTL